MRYTVAALVLFLAGAAGAEAASREKKLPKAASALMQSGESGYVRAKHKGKYDDVTWGTNWKQTLRTEVKPLMHSVTAR